MEQGRFRPGEWMVAVMAVERLFTWWNAIYTLPLLFVLVVLSITAMLGLAGGVLGEMGHGAQTDTDRDADLDHDLDVDADAGGDLAAHAGHGADADGDTDLDADLDGDGTVSPVERAISVGHGHGSLADHGLLVTALVGLGVGRAPLVMLLQILVLLWGAVGMGLHVTFGAAGPAALFWSIPATLVVSVLGTRTFALLFGRFFRQKETYAIRRSEIVGRTGRVVFAVGAEEGTVHVRDRHGTLHRLRARCGHGRLDSGREIIVVGYDPDRNLYQVDDPSVFVDRP